MNTDDQNPNEQSADDQNSDGQSSNGADAQQQDPREQLPQGVPGTSDGTVVEETRAVGHREGMFGVAGSGDVSGYGGLRAPILRNPSTQRPYGGWFDDAADALEEVLEARGLPEALERVVVFRGEITFHVARPHLRTVAQVFRDDERLRFEFCSSVSGVHMPEDQGAELHAVLHLLSMSYNRRVRVETAAPDADPYVPSVVSVYPTADWQEREVWDMFGLRFDGHPALTRILMPDDWPGHPQRKDYPLGGIPVEYKGATVPPPDQRRRYS